MENSVGTIDPRVKEELECLNSASERINQLENKLTEQRNLHRSALTESTQRLNAIAKKLGDCISKARPFYEARRVTKDAHQEVQKAAVNYERSISMHNAAREMVSVAEQGMLKGCQKMDTAWPEMLNHATLKVNEAEMERMNSELEHEQRAKAYKEAELNVKKLNRKLRSNITKSAPYFEMKQSTQKHLEELTEAVRATDTELQREKQTYSQALHNLEVISEAIHASRDAIPELERHRLILEERQAGVGAEEAAVLLDSDYQPRVHRNGSVRSEGSGSMLAVLEDLKKFDSVDDLDQLSLGSSTDETVSCRSTSSHSSFKSVSASADKTESLASRSDPSGHSQISENNFGEGETTKAHRAVGSSDGPGKETSSSTIPSNPSPMPSVGGAVPHPTVQKRRSTPYGGEILLTVAGLAEVSTS